MDINYITVSLSAYVVGIFLTFVFLQPEGHFVDTKDWAKYQAWRFVIAMTWPIAGGWALYQIFDVWRTLECEDKRESGS